METQTKLKIVVQAVHGVTKSHGPARTKTRVASFLQSPGASDPQDLSSIAAMRLGDFYRSSPVNLTATKETLWHNILLLAGDPTTEYPPPPRPPLRKDTTLGEIADYLVTKGK